MVKVYDFATKQLTEIPAAELAPGMIKANIDGVGEAFISTEGTKLSGKRNDLPDGFEPIALAVRKIIGRHLSWVKNDDDWLSGFRADAHPVRELLLWMWVAAVYHEMTHEGRDSQEASSEVFAVLVSAMNNGAQALQTVSLSRLSPARAKSIVERHQSLNSTTDCAAFWADRVDTETLVRLMEGEGGRG